MDPEAVRQLENAIAAISSFLASSNGQPPGEEALRSLSIRIAEVRSARTQYASVLYEDVPRSLASAYLDCLEKLGSRLNELETRLEVERSRCAQGHDNTLRARAWSATFSQLH